MLIGIWSLSIELELRQCSATILIYAVHFLYSRLPHADGMSGRHDGQVWDLGYCRAGAVPQPCTHVLQGSPGCHCGVWHHQHSKWLKVPVCSDSIEPRLPVTERDFLPLAVRRKMWNQSWSSWVFFSGKDTFTRAKNWVKELQRQASPNIVIALAGNKADLANKRAVDLQVIANYKDP